VKECSCCPSEYSVRLLDPRRYRRRVVLLWNRMLVQSFAPAEVSPLLVLRSRCAVSPCLGCAVFLQRAAAEDDQVFGRVLSSSLSFPVEFYPVTPTQPSQRSSPLMGFCSLQHMKEFEVHIAAGQSLPTTFRLQGLATLLTAYSLESRAGFVSHRLRSWDSPFGGLFLSEQALSAFPPQANLPTVDPAFDSAAEAPDRYDEFRLPGSSCRECLVRARRFRPARRQRLPWVLPLQGLLRRPWPRLLPASSHVLCGPWRLLAEFAGTSEYRSAFAPPCPMSHRRASPAKATLVGSLHLPGPEHWGQLCPGYWFTSRSGRALLPAHRSLSGHLAGTLP
jgi:hypothetical protein